MFIWYNLCVALIRDIHVVLKINTDIEYFIKVGSKVDAHFF